MRVSFPGWTFCQSWKEHPPMTGRFCPCILQTAVSQKAGAQGAGRGCTREDAKWAWVSPIDSCYQLPLLVFLSIQVSLIKDFFYRMRKLKKLLMWWIQKHTDKHSHRTMFTIPVAYFWTQGSWQYHKQRALCEIAD